MLDWFEKRAPIRMKFRALLAIHIGLALAAALMCALAWLHALPGMVLIVLALLLVAATAATVRIAAERICAPYVNTVVRMEALAMGDTTGPIHYTDHLDCVGRMTKAMATFRDNAVEVQAARDAQQAVVHDLNLALRALSDGGLDYRIHTAFPPAYEAVRQNFNAAMDSLVEAIDQVRTCAGSVLTGSHEIHAASDDLARRNLQQKASLEEAVAVMDQVTAGVKDTAEAVGDVQNSMTQAQERATAGGAVVGRAIEAMAEIEQSATKIASIISVIDSIAFQTNLLALNAGVEAARAGDAGKGFAVVANEVRALASRTAEAARDIGALISASTRQVESGVALVGETGGLLEAIVDQVREIAHLTSGIAAGAQVQAHNLDQVNAAVGNMDRVTQQNVGMVEQTTAEARALAEAAGKLRTVVDGFRTGTQRAVMPVARRRAMPARLSAVHGNLALKPFDPGEDWS